jgi:hypothetical protein
MSNLIVLADAQGSQSPAKTYNHKINVEKKVKLDERKNAL